jgi:hypothetical protein
VRKRRGKGEPVKDGKWPCAVGGCKGKTGEPEKMGERA